MRVSSLIKIALIISALVTLALTETAMAQFVPYSRYGSGHGWGRLPNSLPSANAVLADKGKDRRQSLAEVNRQQRDRNSFLLSQTKSNSSWIAKNNASVDQFREQRNIVTLEFLYRIQVAEFELGHATADGVFDDHGRDLIVFENRE